MNEVNGAINSTLDFDQIMRRVVNLSADAMGVEAAFINLRREDHWVMKYVSGLPKRYVGMELSDDEARATVRAYTTRQPIVINDAIADVSVNPRIIDRLGIRSLLAVPMIVVGEVIGALFFIYRSAAVPFDDAQIDFGEKVAASVSLALRNAKLYALERDISNTLQEALLAMPARIAGVEYGCLYRSATADVKVGGDFYDLFALPRQRVGLVIGDVSGKGVRAATLTSLAKNSIRAYGAEGYGPATIMTKVNRLILEETDPYTFITVFFGALDLKTGMMSFCNAGHPYPIIKSPDGSSTLITEVAPILGVFDDGGYSAGQHLIRPGATIILYTDGVTEARRHGKLFEETRLVEAVSGIVETDVAKIPDALFSRVMRFTGGERQDDIAILAVRQSRTGIDNLE